MATSRLSRFSALLLQRVYLPGDARRGAMRLEFSAPLSPKRVAFPIQAPETRCRYLQTHSSAPRPRLDERRRRRRGPGHPREVLCRHLPQGARACVTLERVWTLRALGDDAPAPSAGPPASGPPPGAPARSQNRFGQPSVSSGSSVARASSQVKRRKRFECFPSTARVHRGVAVVNAAVRASAPSSSSRPSRASRCSAPDRAGRLMVDVVLITLQMFSA